MYEGIKYFLKQAWDVSMRYASYERLGCGSLPDSKDTTLQIQKNKFTGEQTPRVVRVSRNPFEEESITKFNK